MAVTASLVKELRERTGAGMMECKKALVETNGDIEAAIENMRKSGQAKAAKKAGRIAAEGVVVAEVSADNKTAAIVEVNSETDFVARDENFVAFANNVAKVALTVATDDVDALLAAEYEAGKTVETAREELIAKIGENITVRRVKTVTSEGTVAFYNHGGRIGVVSALTVANADLAKDVAMHVAATQPQCIKPDDVPAELVEKEKEIFRAQALESGKPADIVEKMITGRISKFLNEVSLYGQAFVKDPNTTVGKLVAAENADVTQFVRFEVGEGIEKKQENFAEEVMAQVNA